MSAEPAPTLDRIRGTGDPRPHTARGIAALTVNPGCARRAVIDTAGADKLALAAHVGHPARFGQSQFALSRGVVFERQLKADGGLGLLRVLHQRLVGTDLEEAGGPAVRCEDLAPAGADAGLPGPARLPARARRTADRVAKNADATAAGSGPVVLLDHPLLTLDIAGYPAYLEPDLIVGPLLGRLHIVEIKSFAVVDGQADAAKVSAAAIQAAVYALALRTSLAATGRDPDLVCDSAVLVCPEDFANRPTASLVDLRPHLTVLRRQLGRMARIDQLLSTLPPDLTLDLEPDAAGIPRRAPESLARALTTIPARYVPDCLSACELAGFCRQRARGTTAALGREVREQLGGLDDLDTALALAAGTREPTADQVEAAALLRTAAALRAEALASAREPALASTREPGGAPPGGGR